MSSSWVVWEVLLRSDIEVEIDVKVWKQCSRQQEQVQKWAERRLDWSVG